MSSSKWLLRAQRSLEKLSRTDVESFNMIHRPPYRSMNSGATGVAYAFRKAACVLGDPRWLNTARFWIEHIVSMPDDDPRYELPEEEGTAAEVDIENSFYHGNRGVDFVRMLIVSSQSDAQAFQRAFNAWAKAETRVHRVEDVLQGRPGRLIGDAIVYRETGDEYILRHGNDVADALLSGAFEYDTERPWGNNHLLGMAHGRGGIQYALLFWARTTGYALPDWLLSETERFARSGIERERGVSWPIDERNPERYMDSWCNGAPGLLHLWALAFELTGEPIFLATARRCGEYCVSRREYTLGHVCCGSAGVSYGLLSLHRVDPSGPWLEHAERFAEMTDHARFISIYPLGLYTGLAGYVCLMLDMGDPPRAEQPAFQG